jgi:FKBP-type peptidyl-prolyl cis-trans isomerase FklB
MKRLSRFIPLLLASTLTLPLVACAGARPEEYKPDMTPAQFMAKVRAQPGVVSLPDGLAYKVLQSGPKDGQSPSVGDGLMVIYEGRLPEGGIFDSSDQHGKGAYMQMPLDGVIQGWMEGLPLMHVGDIWMLYVPPELGYGHREMGIIPADSPLIFKIQLLGVTKAQ